MQNVLYTYVLWLVATLLQQQPPPASEDRLAQRSVSGADYITLAPLTVATWFGSTLKSHDGARKMPLKTSDACLTLHRLYSSERD